MGYKCDVCNFETSSVKILNIHKRSEHINEIKSKMKCDMCEFGASSRIDLERHNKSYHKCANCEFRTEKQTDLLKHKKNAHKIKCSTCAFEAGTKEEVKKHSDGRHESKIYQCDRCDYSSPHQGVLTIHVKNKHLGVRFELVGLGLSAQNAITKQRREEIWRFTSRRCTMESFTTAICAIIRPAPKEVLVCTRNQNIDDNRDGGGRRPCLRAFKQFYGLHYSHSHYSDHKRNQARPTADKTIAKIFPKTPKLKK